MSLPPKPYQSRVTIDIDSYAHAPEYTLTRAYHGLVNAGAEDVVVAVSSSGEGFHVEAGFMERLDDEQKQRLREQYGDDKKRVAVDEHRELTSQTMFNSKSGRETTRQVFSNPWDAIEYVRECARTDAERVRALANDGRRILGPDIPKHAP